MPDRHTVRIEGYAIVSEDGMLATAAGIMPESLKFDADARFFEARLNRVDVVVHGRHSEERQPNSPQRRRIILTRQVAAIEKHPSNVNALLWNPAGASFEKRSPPWEFPMRLSASSVDPTFSGASWIATTPSICRVRPTCAYPAGAPYFQKFLPGRRRTC